MRCMKKSMIVIGAVAVAILMVSTATAVGTVNSESIVNNINSLEEEMPATESQLLESIQEGLYDLEDFKNYLMSDDFMDFMNSNAVANIINSDVFQTFYNLDEIQDFIQSDVFIDFKNSELGQYFLEHYNPPEDDENLVASSQANNQASQEVEIGTYMSISEVVNCGLEGVTSSQVNVIDDGPECSMSSTATFVVMENGYEPTKYILGLFLYLLIGLITWPIALGIFGLGAPLIGLWIGFWITIFEMPPSGFIAPFFVLFTIIYTLGSLVVAIIWPAVWLLVILMYC